MTGPATGRAPAIAPAVWLEGNAAYLDTALRSVRLLLRRRILWLRRHWQHDPLKAYQGMVIGDAQADWLADGNDARAEERFYREDTEASAISRSIVETEEALADHAAAMARAGAPPALETLAHLFGLTAFERDVILLCLAPEVDASFERLYAYVQDDVGRRYATPDLALTLCMCQNRRTARDSFMPDARLRRYRLVDVDMTAAAGTSAIARALRLDERIVDYVRGVNRFDTRVAEILRPLGPTLLAPAHEAVVEHLLGTDFWRAGDGLGMPLNIVGGVDRGARAIAHVLCERLGLQVYLLDIKRVASGTSDREDTLRLLEREAVLGQAALYIEVAEAVAYDGGALDALRDLVDRLTTFFVLASHDRWLTERPMFVATTPPPSPETGCTLWRRVLDGIPHTVDGQIETIVEQFDLGPAAVRQAAILARNRAALRQANDRAITVDDVWEACRGVTRSRLDDLARPLTSCHTWNDIVLPGGVQHQLREMAAQVAHRSVVFGRWGFGARAGRGRGLAALFSGPSGTGKTMAAEIIANQLKLDVYRIDLAGVVSKYIGETEKNLRRVFDAAEQGGAILFFDEADALFGKRTDVRDSHDRYANIEIDYLLQRMEEFRGLAILATNRRASLDRAFLRRLRFVVEFPFPDTAARRAIWQRVFPPEAPLDRLDFDVLARLEIAGGNIKNVAINAAFLAADDGAAIGMRHVMRAAGREYAKLDKLIAPAEFGPYTEPAKA